MKHLPSRALEAGVRDPAGLLSGNLHQQGWRLFCLLGNVSRETSRCSIYSLASDWAPKGDPGVGVRTCECLAIVYLTNTDGTDGGVAPFSGAFRQLYVSEGPGRRYYRSTPDTLYVGMVLDMAACDK